MEIIEALRLKKRLVLTGIRIEFPGVKRFSVAETFCNPENSDGVPLASPQEKFRRSIGRRVERNLAPATIRVSQLALPSLDLPVLLELGESGIVKFAHMWWVLRHATEHLLGADPAIWGHNPRDHFYAYDSRGILWCHNIHRHDDGKYGIGARSIECPHELDAGTQIFWAET